MKNSVFLILNIIPVFTQIALLSGLLPYKPISQPISSNPEPSYVPHDIFAQSHLQIPGKTNGAHASETGLSGRANQL
jgi:hypothetical protein